MYDVRLNQYTLWVNGKIKVLLPFVEIPYEANFTTIRIFMSNGDHFVRDMKKVKAFFIVIPS